jgi:hypothetical protein
MYVHTHFYREAKLSSRLVRSVPYRWCVLETQTGIYAGGRCRFVGPPDDLLRRQARQVLVRADVKVVPLAVRHQEIVVVADSGCSDVRVRSENEGLR